MTVRIPGHGPFAAQEDRDSLSAELESYPAISVESARLLADSMLGAPSLVDGEPMDEGEVMREVFNFHLLTDGVRFGWLSREGRWLGCAYAAHDRLLRHLGVETVSLETAGWARVGNRGYQCLFRLSPRQRAALEKAGVPVDPSEERLRPPFPGADPARPPRA